MPEKDPETIARWYDALSKSYEELYGEEQHEKYSKVLGLLGDGKFELIVDVGCGTGKLLELVSTRTHLALGIDISAQMLKIAKLREDSIQWIRADASGLPLRDRVSDGVLSVSMTESGSKFTQQLRELSRIASEDATLIITTFNTTSKTLSKLEIGRKVHTETKLSEREQLYLLHGTEQLQDHDPSPRL